MKPNLAIMALCCVSLSASAQVESYRPMAPGTIFTVPSNPSIVMHSNNGQTVFTIKPGKDGRYVVELGPGMSDDEAAREFWRMVKTMAPTMGCKK